MTHSSTLFSKAQRYIPGGVNSPVRAFKGVGGDPIFFKRGEGAYIIDVDNRRYIDYVGSWGPLILGHDNPAIKKAVHFAVDNGLSFGAPTELEVLLAEKICQIMPGIEMVRMVNSGTEATMSAIRLARGVTGRNKILKFEGCYHGHSDSLLVKAGSGPLTLGIPGSPGVPADIVQHTLTASFNNLEEVKKIFEKFGEEIATVIIEPIAGNMNFVLPQPGFLPGLRKICDDYGSLLLFDEVMTGFRVALGGAQSHYGVTPDLTTLGKVIGGGMPVGAFGGKRKIMEQLAPLGPVYQAGTLSGNPVAMAAGLTALNEISVPGFFEALSVTTQRLISGLQSCAREANVPFIASSLGGMFGFFFTDRLSIASLDDVQKCDVPQFQQFFHAMLKQGIYFAPSAFEAGFVSGAHGAEEIEKTLEAAKKAFQNIMVTAHA